MTSQQLGTSCLQSSSSCVHTGSYFYECQPSPDAWPVSCMLGLELRLSFINYLNFNATLIAFQHLLQRAAYARHTFLLTYFLKPVINSLEVSRRLALVHGQHWYVTPKYIVKICFVAVVVNLKWQQQSVSIYIKTYTGRLFFLKL